MICKRSGCDCARARCQHCRRLMCAGAICPVDGCIACDGARRVRERPARIAAERAVWGVLEMLPSAPPSRIRRVA